MRSRPAVRSRPIGPQCRRKGAQSTAWTAGTGTVDCDRGLEPLLMRRVLIGLILIALIAVSASVGVLVANGPACVHYLQARR